MCLHVFVVLFLHVTALIKSHMAVLSLRTSSSSWQRLVSSFYNCMAVEMVAGERENRLQGGSSM